MPSAPWSTIDVGGNNSDLFRDINATFLSTYRNVVGQNRRLSMAMRLGVSSTKRIERYGYYESPPTIDRVDHKEAIGEDALRAVSYQVENLRWGKAIGWCEEDEEDVQLSSLREVAGRMGRRMAQVSEEVFFQILTGTASARLLETIPTAPDGSALYAALAGGNPRFGATGGNIVTGSGIASAQDVRNDFWGTVSRMRLFQDTEGQPLLTDDELDGPLLVIYGAGNEEVFREAFSQGRTLQTAFGAVGAVSTVPESAAGGAVTNTILESGRQITLWSTQRIATDDWFVFAGNADPKPLFEQIRRAPRTIDETRENSERARRNGVLAAVMDARMGYGVNTPYFTVQVDN